MGTDAGTLISAADVAEILGLSHRNSVSTYRRRYPDFPEPTPSPHGGRTLLWDRDEILAWHRAWADPQRRGSDGQARLDGLVDAAVALLLESPAADIGVRQIAAAAGMAHSDVYRYADSKQQILELAAQRLVDSFRLDMPGSLAEVIAQRTALVEAALSRRGAMRVVMAEVLRHPNTELAAPTPSRHLAELVRRDREHGGRSEVVRPEVIAGSAAALVWGWALLGPRMCDVMGIPEVPAEEIAEVMRAILEA